jgi:hypothetical protein
MRWVRFEKTDCRFQIIEDPHATSSREPADVRSVITLGLGAEIKAGPPSAGGDEVDGHVRRGDGAADGLAVAREPE